MYLYVERCYFSPIHSGHHTFVLPSPNQTPLLEHTSCTQSLCHFQTHALTTLPNRPSLDLELLSVVRMQLFFGLLQMLLLLWGLQGHSSRPRSGHVHPTPGRAFQPAPVDRQHAHAMPNVHPAPHQQHRLAPPQAAHQVNPAQMLGLLTTIYNRVHLSDYRVASMHAQVATLHDAHQRRDEPDAAEGANASVSAETEEQRGRWRTRIRNGLRRMMKRVSSRKA
jgi:hypothetical protein